MISVSNALVFLKANFLHAIDNKYLNMRWEDTTFECVMAKSSCKKNEQEIIMLAFTITHKTEAPGMTNFTIKLAMPIVPDEVEQLRHLVGCTAELMAYASEKAGKVKPILKIIK